MKEIILYSPIHLENWNHKTIDTTGIGGSETCHVLLAEEFAKQGYLVTSIAPCEKEYIGPGSVAWTPLDTVDLVLKESNKNQIWLVFRDPSFFDKVKKRKRQKGPKFYFIAQDVQYSWTDEQLEKVDKYICLCQKHAEHTLAIHPQLKGRIFVSSNGIRSDLIRKKIETFKGKRQPKRLIYSSSPDRGLLLILENWFRVIERHPDAELHIYYGFDNLLTIAKRNNNVELMALYEVILNLANKYESVFLHGRIPQLELYDEMLKSSVWFYPSDWPETSCITSMEMQACGVYPILNDYWAQGENVFGGVKVQGVPQKDKLCKAILIKELIKYMDNEEDQLKMGFEETNILIRADLREDALDSFDWKKIAKQYISWIENEK